MAQNIYEVCDTTNCEMYFPLGIFYSLSDAMRAVSKLDEGLESITEFGAEDCESEEVSIFERPYGFSYRHGDVVVKYSRECTCIDDEYVWKTTEIDFCAFGVKYKNTGSAGDADKPHNT
jgi:hypothetical protein